MGHSTTQARKRLTLPLQLRAKMIGGAMFVSGFMGLIISAKLDPLSAHVERVIDGDTIQVRFESKRYTVRLIGVDTPETKHPTKPVQYFGREASAFTKAALAGKTVLLQKDRTGDTVRPLRALASLRPAGRRQLQRPAHPRRLRSCLPALSLLEADGVYTTGRTSSAARNRLMEPPLGSQPCPLGLVQPLQPGGRSQAGRGSPQGRPGRPLFAPIKSPRSIDPESPAEPREGDNPFRSAPNPSQRLPDKPGARLRHVSALPVRRVRFGPSQLPRQNASLTFGVCHSRCFCRPWPVTGAGGAFLPRQRLGVFRHSRAERKTLTNP